MEVTKWLDAYVLARLSPLDIDSDLAFADHFGIEEFPRILLLDPEGEKALGDCGDVSPEEVAATLRKALGR
ncbi:MAG: hypothetical protein MUE73_10955 [Planctomycetes bacterium]|jgi:hypothetical protein|nr:hypothetical protein [Planctomycetota bacterium]